MLCLRNVIARSTNLTKIMSFYAVAKGHQVGIFDNWAKCEEQVKGFKGAKYKKFKLKADAEDFIKAHGGTILSSHQPAGKFIALGAKGHETITNEDAKRVENEKQVEETPDDFWPECDGDDYDFPDDDLLLAVQEAEDLTSTKAPKRKHPDSTSVSQGKSKERKIDSKIWEPIGTKKIGQHNYQIDCEDFVICYTDGSCFNNGRENACAGFGVYFDDNHPLNIGEPVKGRVTNNVGEIQAAIKAIKIAKEHNIKKLCISTDSQFLIKSITMWINAWKRKGWCLKNGDPVKNVDDFKELDSLLQSSDLMVKWNYVKGHGGIKGNEMADKLARQGSEIYKRLHGIK